MKLGIIGGSGVYDIEGLESVERRALHTPYGAPSDKFVIGQLGGQEVCFLPRHGKGHSLMPSEINHRANIFGMKMLDVERVLSVSAVGSLKENLHPRDIVLPDQYFDRTKRSQDHTFFGNGVVAHVSFGDPTCPELGGLVAAAARKVLAAHPEQAQVQVQEGGTYVNMEGPAFSTKAESGYYRSVGFDVIGMTSLAEAKLCREAELCYQAMALVTDYDCWHEEEGPVSVEMVIQTLTQNTALAKEIITALLADLPGETGCSCDSALANALITPKDQIAPQVREVLAPLIGKYV